MGGWHCTQGELSAASGGDRFRGFIDERGTERDDCFLEVFQRGQCDLGAFGVGAMNGFAVVAQGKLGEPFRIPDDFRPLGPRVTIRVKGYTVNAKSEAALLELRGAVAGAHGCKVGEQMADSGKCNQDRFHSFSKPNLGRLLIPPARLHPEKADHPVGPIDILGLEVGEIRLGSPQVPGQLVKGFAFRVRLPIHDSPMFF